MPKKEKVKSPKMPISPKQNELMDTPFGVSKLTTLASSANIIEYI